MSISETRYCSSRVNARAWTFNLDLVIMGSGVAAAIGRQSQPFPTHRPLAFAIKYIRVIVALVFRGHPNPLVLEEACFMYPGTVCCARA